MYNKTHILLLSISLLLAAHGTISYGMDPKSELAKALHAQDYSRVELIIKAQPALARMKIDNRDSTLLHWASRKNRPELVQLLIAAEADVNAQNYCGNTPLHIAVEINSMEVVQLLIAAKANINLQNCRLLIPMPLPMSANIVGTSYLLFNEGADVNQQGYHGATPFSMAVELGHTEMVQLFLKSGADVKLQDDGYTPLQWALIYGNISEVETFIQHQISYINQQDNHGRTLLHLAAKFGHTKIAQLLVQAGANINIQDEGGDTPLHIAAIFNHIEIAKILIQHGAQVNVQNTNHVQRPYAPSLSASHGNTPLHVAAEKNLLELAQLLIDAKADANMPDGNGETPLYLAVARDYIEIVQLLIKANAEINIQFKDRKHPDGVFHGRSNTPLHSAMRLNSIAAAQLLIGAGANVNIQNADGETPLRIAAESYHPKMARLLIAKGAQFNAEDLNTWNVTNTMRKLLESYCQHIDSASSLERKREIAFTLAKGLYSPQSQISRLDQDLVHMIAKLSIEAEGVDTRQHIIKINKRKRKLEASTDELPAKKR